MGLVLAGVFGLVAIIVLWRVMRRRSPARRGYSEHAGLESTTLGDLTPGDYSGHHGCNDGGSDAGGDGGGD